MVGSTEAGIDRERVGMDGTGIETGYVSGDMVGDITEGQLGSLTGMSTVGLEASIGTGDDWDRISVRTCKAVGEERGELVGCVRSMREDFIGKV